MLTLITKPEEMFVEKDWPEEAVPKKAVKSLEELKDKRLNKNITEDLPLTTDDLVNKDLDGLSAMLKPGSRAVAIPVTPESLAGGFVLPGMRVDVILTTREGEISSNTILQDMLVLAVENQSSRPEQGTTMLGNTATLAATPQEVLELRTAAASGTLCLMLRGVGDEDKLHNRTVKRSDLLKGNSGAGSSAPRAEETTTVQAAAFKIPDLPPVNEPVENPMVVVKEPEVEVKKAHVMRITSGESVQKVEFFQNTDGSWGDKAGKGEAEDLPNGRPNKAKAAWPKGAPPRPAKKDPAVVAEEPRPKTVAEKLQENSGLPPVPQR
jgi:Flp pilus assembly protein CpaB